MSQTFKFLKPIDKKSRLIARIFGVAFTLFLYKPLFLGFFSYNSMGSEITITASSNPLKFYFAIVWCAFMIVVCFYFSFIATLKNE